VTPAKKPATTVERQGGSRARLAPQTVEPEPSRLERRREARKEAILRAAGVELAQAGFSRVSLDDIAERVNVTKATLYHYFSNKEALYQGWMDHVTVEVRERLEAVVDESDSPTARLRKLVRAEVLILTEEFPDYARLFMSGVDWPQAFQERIRELRRAHESYFGQAIKDGVASGEFDPVDESVARYCLQGALAYVPEWYHGGGRLSLDEVAELVADSLMRMFRKDP
jgi:AcrR family transcriptional regulator